MEFISINNYNKCAKNKMIEGNIKLYFKISIQSNN